MTKLKPAITVIISSSAFTLGLFLLWLGLVKGISIRGRWFERILLSSYIISNIISIYEFKKVKSKRIRTWIVANIFTPISITILGLFFTPIFIIYFYISIIFGLATENNSFYENEKYTINSSLSLMTNMSYDLILKEGIIERKIMTFSTELDLSKTQISISNNTILLEKGSIQQEHTIKR